MPRVPRALTDPPFGVNLLLHSEVSPPAEVACPSSASASVTGTGVGDSTVITDAFTGL